MVGGNRIRNIVIVQDKDGSFHVIDDKGTIHVTFKPTGELKKERAARQAKHY